MVEVERIMTTIPMLASIGLSDKEQATLQAVISVAAGLEIGPWQLAEHSQKITAVFVNLDTASAKEWLADIQRQGNASLLIMCTAQKQLDAPYAYQISSPLNYRSVVLLLKEIEAQHNRTKTSQDETLITAEGLQSTLRHYPYQAPEMLTVEESESVQPESLDEELPEIVQSEPSIGEDDVENIVSELPSSNEEALNIDLNDSEVSPKIPPDTESEVESCFDDQAENVQLTPEVNDNLLGVALEDESTPSVSPGLELEVENCFEDRVDDVLERSSDSDVDLNIESEEAIPVISSEVEVEHHIEELPEEPEASLEGEIDLPSKTESSIDESTVVSLQVANDELAADKKTPLKKSHTYLPQRSLFDVPLKAKSNKSADDLLQMLNRPAMRFYRYTRLLGLVHSIVEQKQAAVVTHPTLPAIVISPENGVFGTIEPLDHEPELFTTAAYKFQVQEISSADLGDVMVGCIVQPLWALFYSAALFGSEGRLMEAFAPCDVLRLKRAPDFKRVPHCREHIKLSKYLVSHNVDMIALAQITEIPLSVVIDFCNACEEAGLIKRLPAVNQGFDGGSNGFTRQAKVAGFPSPGEHKKTKFKHRVLSSFCREKDGASLRAANDSR